LARRDVGSLSSVKTVPHRRPEERSECGRDQRRGRPRVGTHPRRGSSPEADAPDCRWHSGDDVPRRRCRPEQEGSSIRKTAFSLSHESVAAPKVHWGLQPPPPHFTGGRSRRTKTSGDRAGRGEWGLRARRERLGPGLHSRDPVRRRTHADRDHQAHYEGDHRKSVGVRRDRRRTTRRE
jgi:hypothetical protein